MASLGPPLVRENQHARFRCGGQPRVPQAGLHASVKSTLEGVSGIPRVDCESGRLGGPDIPRDYPASSPPGLQGSHLLRAQSMGSVCSLARNIPSPAVHRIGLCPGVPSSLGESTRYTQRPDMPGPPQNETHVFETQHQNKTLLPHTNPPSLKRNPKRSKRPF